MSLDLELTRVQETTVLDTNIMHNLGHIARAAGIYKLCCRPDEIGVFYASDMIDRLECMLEKLKADPGYFRTFDSPNGWGIYDHYVPWVERLIAAYREYPDTKVKS